MHDKVMIAGQAGSGGPDIADIEISQFGRFISFTSYWNDFFWSLIVTTQPSMFMINVGLASLIGPYDYQYGIQLCGALLASLPVIVVFLIFQRQFVEGLTQGAFKGA